MGDITSNFFNTAAPCPKEIPDCQNLRQEYLETLDSLKRQGGCNSCAERNLKNNFIKRISEIIKK